MLALGVLVLTVAAVGFAVGYLGALDEPPASGPVPEAPANLPGAADFLGTVTSAGDEVVVTDEDGRTHTYSLADVTVLAVGQSAVDTLEEGDLVVVAVERDQFGSPAVRYLIRVPAEARANGTP
ncbi:MAG: hypothetical protein WEC33_06705 [Dehalococcoidia bacterium]